MSPVGVCCLLFITVSVCFWVPADCYADGKVTKVCGSMEPHHGVPSQTTQSPFQLVTNASTFSPTDRIQVILSGRSYFEGFLLQARDAANEGSVSTVGTFTLTNPKRTQLLACNKHQSVIFELSGPAEGYIAFALSWDTWMKSFIKSLLLAVLALGNAGFLIALLFSIADI
ncbi:putative ferric-chelate reductase 1 [Collichthys lucidus]|uniref:Putative ferric-chelate reductase 1 n=1 Tax=Collichthys lucidus TaxID=240159 RepID=A0A4U5UYY8_COLLU|nr:putative ferric-chelate reductase 1 [Collichthys lucidus]